MRPRMHVAFLPSVSSEPPTFSAPVSAAAPFPVYFLLILIPSPPVHTLRHVLVVSDYKNERKEKTKKKEKKRKEERERERENTHTRTQKKEGKKKVGGA